MEVVIFDVSIILSIVLLNYVLYTTRQTVKGQQKQIEFLMRDWVRLQKEVELIKQPDSRPNPDEYHDRVSESRYAK